MGDSPSAIDAPRRKLLLQSHLFNGFAKSAPRPTLNRGMWILADRIWDSFACKETDSVPDGEIYAVKFGRISAEEEDPRLESGDPSRIDPEVSPQPAYC